MKETGNENSQQNKNKKAEWGITQLLLPAIGAVSVMIATQITQIYTNDWSKLHKILFAIIIAILYLVAVMGYALVVAICNARNKGKDIVRASEKIELATQKIEITLEDIKSFKFVLEQLSSSVEEFSSFSSSTSQFFKSNDLYQYILNGKTVVELESSVGSYDKKYEEELDIYVQSSEFTLEESGDLFEAIIWNLRKGVRYKYMIPNNKIDKYKKMLRHWFRVFSCICVSKREYEEFCNKYTSYEYKKYSEYWCDEYSKINSDAEALWMKDNPSDEEVSRLRKRCEKLFKDLISTYVEEPNLFYVTVALYEVKVDEWEAIVKLPTRDINEEYYAFKIPGGSTGISKKNFVETFKLYYKEERKHEIDFEHDVFKWRV